jgi:uncharacterized protein
LCAGADLPPALASEIEDLLAKKAVTRELGLGPVPAAILAIILQELDRAETDYPAVFNNRDEAHARAEDFFRTMVATANA